MARRRGTRKWEVFAGRNAFWCDGRAMTAPRPRALGATLALVAGAAALHLALDGPVLWVRVSPALPAAAAALLAATLAALLRTALADPGIVPRAPPHEAPPGAAGSRPPPRARDVLVRGRPLRLKYCFTCRLFRPPRASHCSLCDNCVERFDHHCPWVGNCVGRRNYRHFYTFVVSLAFLAVWVCACCVARVWLEARAAGAAAALRAAPHAAVVAALCFVAAWSVLGLAGFHTYLAATEQTTNEDIKGAWSARRGHSNPYSRGGACANCCHVLCGPLAPSLIDRRGPADDPRERLPPALAAHLAGGVASGPNNNRPNNTFAPLEVIVTSPRSSPPAGPGPPMALVPHTPWAPSQGYTNHSLEMDTISQTGADGGLSASRRRLLTATTMIDAALDLDDPELASSPAVLGSPGPLGPPNSQGSHAPPLGPLSPPPSTLTAPVRVV